MRRALLLPVLALVGVAVLAGCTDDGPSAPRASAARSPGPADEGGQESPTRTPSTAAARDLLDAAARGDRATVQRLLAAGVPPDVVDDQGRTPLVRAAYGNHVEVARVLVAAGADVDRKDASQQSAYLIATSEVGDDPRLLALTLDAGADVDAKDSYDGTGLIRAAERGHPRIVERLLEAGIAKDHVNRLGWTALLEAIVLGDGGPAHVETVRVLLAGGVDPDLPDSHGTTPLEHAQRADQEAVVELLRGAGARG